MTRSYRPVTMPQRNKARELRAKGLTYTEIADAVGISTGAIKYHVKDIPPPPQGWRPRSRPAFDYAEALRLQENGMTREQIAHHLGASVAAVKTALYQIRRKMRGDGPPDWKVRADAIREAKWSGMSHLEIMGKFDISMNTVIAHTRGVPNTAKLGRPRKISYAEIAALRAKGLTYSVISERLGVSRPTVWIAIKREQAKAQATKEAA